ncbi:MAG TPA: Ohr family peroxiredoxin [Acholeplasmataceae bacterium]|jgi:Ohr subfamily peroxiredoxin|nr:Ohr family peroxiredoxin [Acholeplasmataceae bacterium]HRX44428.1 Ohr family peroxiredoxin [Acholeplasmataceae bacterium]
MKKILERSATTKGGRDGLITDMSSKLVLKMTKPLEMGGNNQTGTNPEELFSAGYSACFASSLEYLLLSEKVAYDNLSVKATTELLANPKTGFYFKLLVDVKIDGVSEEIRQVYIKKAYGFCPYSKAIKGNVEVIFNA